MLSLFMEVFVFDDVIVLVFQAHNIIRSILKSTIIHVIELLIQFTAISYE